MEGLEWFTKRMDRVILLFDASEVGISKEFSEVIKARRTRDALVEVPGLEAQAAGHDG